MASPKTFPLRLSEVDHYLLRMLALTEGKSANAVVTELLQAELDRKLPGQRQAFENREQIAEAVLHRRGIDPQSANYQDAARRARGVLDGIDRRGAGRTA